MTTLFSIFTEALLIRSSSTFTTNRVLAWRDLTLGSISIYTSTAKLHLGWYMRVYTSSTPSNVQASLAVHISMVLQISLFIMWFMYILRRWWYDFLHASTRIKVKLASTTHILHICVLRILYLCVCVLQIWWTYLPQLKRAESYLNKRSHTHTHE